MIIYIVGILFVLSTAPCLLVVIYLIIRGGLEDALDIDDEYDSDNDYNYDSNNQIEYYDANDSSASNSEINMS